MADESRRAAASARETVRHAMPSTGVPERLAPLDELPDYKVADGDPDVRGWDVESADGEKIGEVHDLIVDVAAMKVRYLDVDVDNALLNTEEDRHILVPVGCATLNADHDEVDLLNVNAADLNSIPPFTHGPITRDLESSLRDCYTARSTGTTRGSGTTRAGTAPAAPSAAGGASTAGAEIDESFYGHDHFNERHFFGTRRRGRENERYITHSGGVQAMETPAVRAGEVDVSRPVETEHRSTAVPGKPVQPTVEGRPPQPGMSASPRRGETEIRIPVADEGSVVREERADVKRGGRRKRT